MSSPIISFVTAHEGCEAELALTSQAGCERLERRAKTVSSVSKMRYSGAKLPQEKPSEEDREVVGPVKLNVAYRLPVVRLAALGSIPAWAGSFAGKAVAQQLNFAVGSFHFGLLLAGRVHLGGEKN